MSMSIGEMEEFILEIARISLPPLLKISSTKSLRQRVNFMNVAIRSVQRLDPESGITATEQQINFRKQLINELQNQVQEFSSRE